MTSITTDISNGRLCNQILRSIATSLVAERHDMKITYGIYDTLREFGLNLFNGSNEWNSTIELNDSNYFDILNSKKLESNLNPNKSFFQTKEIIQKIYEFIVSNKLSIVEANQFKERYTTNNDCFVHVRLSDASIWNPGFAYYDTVLSNLKYDTLYISTDEKDHILIKQLRSKYSGTIIDSNEVDTIKFASTAKYVVLSHGTFSSVIGYLSFFSSVYYPDFGFIKKWHGDIFSIDGWNRVYYSSYTKEDIITTDKYLSAFSNSYYKTDCILSKSPISWRGTQHEPPSKNQKIIISGHSDYGITEDLVEYYNPQIWWAVNKQTLSSRVHALPLGITNDTHESSLHPIYGNLDCMIQVMNEPKQSKNLVYLNFNQNTHPERKAVYDIFNSKDWITLGQIENTVEGRTNFLRDIRNHTFVLCPRGNGIDTHRLWETLYMGSIPIVKKDIGYSDFSDLPICFVDSWDQVTPEFLETEKQRIESRSWNLDKLKVSYWINKIRDTYVDWNSMNTGQIKLGQGIGKWIKKYAEDLRFSRYFEIGTWNGGGSTVCVASGFSNRKDDPKLKSIETNLERYTEALSKWKGFNSIEIIHGRIFRDGEIPSFDVIQKVHSSINREWHQGDIDNFKTASYVDVLSYLPEVVILDGGEYMTYFEYLKVKDFAKVLILDDTSVAKCKRIVEELVASNHWKLIDCNPTERNGWHVFERCECIKLFNMDLHISVIADFKNLFPEYMITQWSMSNHTWVFGNNKENPNHINSSTWQKIDMKMIKDFQNQYDSFLSTFDGFICGHPNVFAMIFEKYNKPIILINSCRYDMPFCWSKNQEMKQEYINCLKRIQSKKLLIAVSNNLGDQLYTKLDCGIVTEHIPSLCEYTGIKYAPNKNKFLCYHGNIDHPLVENLKRPFSWSDIGTYKGIIHIPYEISTMSMFEHYSAGIPMFFPTKEFMTNTVSIQSNSAYGNQNVLTDQQWLELADFYTVFRSPNIHLFNSYEELYSLLEKFEWKDDSEAINLHKDKIVSHWINQLSLLFPVIPIKRKIDKVFSFCIYGTERNYYDGLLENIKIIKQYFPDFEIYIYKGVCDSTWTFDSDSNVTIIETGKEGGINTLLRFLPLSFSQIGFIRDADSRITQRDRWCISEFLKSSKKYHIVRDHFWHKSKIMAGTFGWKSPMNINIPDTINTSYGFEELYIGTHIYPFIKSESLVHTNNYAFAGEYVELISIPHEDKYDFVGNVIWNGNPKFEYTVGSPIQLVEWLRGQDQFRLIQHISDRVDFKIIPYHSRRSFLDAAYIANYYLRDIPKAQHWLSQFEFAELDGHIYANSNFLFGILGKKIVATFDYKREPLENEIVVVYGNYPDWHHALPCSSKLYRHVSMFFQLKHDVVEYHPSWESIDTIYILNLKERSDRYSDTLLALAAVHAPLHRVYHYKAEKDGLPPYVGATKNHVDVMKHFQESNAKTCLIVEDDIVFLDDKEHVWNNLVTFFERKYNYNIAFLSISKNGQRDPMDDLMSISKQPCTTSAAYFLNKETSKTVLDVADEGLRLMQETNNHHTYCIDRYWCKLPDLLFFKKKLVYQRPSFSNLTKSVNFHLD